MKPFTQEELELAFHYWDFEYPQKDKVDPREDGWLRKVRTAQFYSAKTIASRLKISRSAYSQHEASEKNGSISIKILEKLAQAMDCELVYSIRPKNKLSFSRNVWDKLLPKAMKHPWLEKCDQRRRAAALAKIIRDTFEDTEFRRKQGWSTRA